jgi:site-specific DNA recombinase
MIDIFKDIGATQIAKELTESDYSTKLGNTNWSESSVRGILKNVKYKGDVLQGKTYTIDPISHKRKINMGEQDKYYMENHHESIISEEIWNKAQEIMQTRRETCCDAGIKEGYFNTKYAFSNSMECAFCGRVISRKKWGKDKVGWQCMAAIKKGKKDCNNSKVIPQNVIEKAFIEVHKMLLANNQEIVNDFFEKVEKAIKKNNTLETIQTLKEKEKSLQSQIKKLLDMSLNEIITEEEYTKKRSELDKKLAEVNKNITKNAGISKTEKRIHDRVSNMKQNLKCNKNIIEYFDEDAYKCLIKKVIVGENENNNIDPYVLNFILNSDNIKNNEAELDELKMQIAEFDCKVDYFVFNIDENNNRSKEMKRSIKVKVFSDIDTNINIEP